MKIAIEINLSTRQKRVLAALVIPAVLAGAGAVAYANVQHTWKEGEVLGAADLNDNFSALDKRVATIESNVTPPGTVTAYAAPVGGAVDPPLGWLLCNGSAVSRTKYAGLFAVIGTTAGVGDGTTTFNLPDYRGYFLRGVDQGAGRDPEAATRTPMANGSNSGDAVNTLEAEAFKMHAHGGTTGGTHTQMTWTNAARDYSGGPGPSCVGFPYVNVTGCGNFFDEHVHDIAPQGGTETRPVNAAVNYLVKY